MDKKILTITGIVFALLFVVILSVMMGVITKQSNDATAQLTETLGGAESISLSKYDDKEVKGNAVTAAISSGKGMSVDSKMFFFVKTLAGESTCYGYGSTTGENQFSGLKYKENGELPEEPNFTETVYANNSYKEYSGTDSSSNGYINEHATFHSHLLENSNGVVVGIYFEQIDAG